MRSFIKNLILYSAIILVCFSMIWCGIVISQKWVLEKCVLNGDTEKLILGDSHTMWSINDCNLEGIQNISLNAEGYIFTYLKLLEVLSHGSNITKVYLAFSYHNLSSYYDDYIYGSKAPYFISRYFGILNLNDFWYLLSKNPVNIPKFTKEGLKKSVAVIYRKNCLLYSSFPKERMTNTFNLTFMEKRINEQYYNEGKELNVSELNLKYLHKIIDLCKEKEIEIMFLSTPLQEEYKKQIPKKFVIRFNHLINKSGITVYDFNDLVLPDTCFLPDGDHVNYFGALLTTEKFKEFIKNVEATYEN